MTHRYDVIVAGLGAMGSATAAHLALRGMYFENPMYVPLIQRAYELWAEAEG